MMDLTQKESYFGAFAHGVVPKGIDESWLEGRQDEYDGLLHMLDRAKHSGLSSFKLISGKYGSGKSMILSVYENRAIDDGFVVSRFSLGNHNNFSKPEIIYRDVMTHLKVMRGDQIQDFEEIFHEWLKTIKSDKRSGQASKEIYQVIKELQKHHPSFAAVLLVYIRGKINHDLELSDIAAAWIKGDYNLPYEKKKLLRVKGSVDRHNAFDILQGFSKLVNLLGYSGLVILVDELEYIIRERVDIRNKAYTMMRQFIDAIGENKWYQTVFVGAQTPDLMLDDDKGYKSYEALYQRLASGFDDKGLVTDYKHASVIPLSVLSDESLCKIGKKVVDLSEVKADSTHLANLALVEYRKKQQATNERPVIREYIKVVIHMVEMAMSQPEMPIFQVNRQ